MKDLWEIAVDKSIDNIILGKTISEAVHIAVNKLDVERLGKILTMYDICVVDYEEFIFRTVVDKLQKLVKEDYVEMHHLVTEDIFKQLKHK